MDEESLKPSKSSQGLNILNYEYEIDSDLDEEDEQMCIELNEEMQQDKRNLIQRIVMECISIERAKEYQQWLNIGMALKNTSRGLLDLWEEYSKQDSGWEEGACKKKWDSFGECSNGLTEATLHWMAKLDNIRDNKGNLIYDIIKEDSMVELIDKSVKEGGAHDDIAKVVHNYLKDKYVCVEIRGNVWYNFDETKWNLCSQGYKLQAELPSKIKLMYNRSERRFRDMNIVRQNNGEQESEDIKKWEETARKIYNKLKDVPFQKNIMEACKNKFYNDKFREEMDSNTKLLCFENCVFDLENNILRPGYPEDKLTISTKYDLPVKNN